MTSCVVGALERDENVPPAALQLLLKRFSATGRHDLAEHLGAALAREVDRKAPRSADGECDWLILFSEATVLSDDARLRDAVIELLPRVRIGWSKGNVAAAMRAVEACLVSVNVAGVRALAADAVDALERIVSGAYRPGEGMAHEAGATPFVRGGIDDHVCAASALLTAHALTGRLPYAMLADELMQGAVRVRSEQDVPFALDCETARVFCRLALLHRDEEYRRTAILAVGTDYAEEATRMLTRLEPRARARGVESAPFGLALAEWLNLQ